MKGNGKEGFPSWPWESQKIWARRAVNSPGERRVLESWMRKDPCDPQAFISPKYWVT